MDHNDYAPWEIAPISASAVLGIGLGGLVFGIFSGQTLEINIDL